MIVGVPVALAGAWKALRELALGTREKAKENRIRQALAARDMLKDLFASAKARAALQMLDWSGRSYSDGDHPFEVRATDLGDALRTDRLAFDHKQMFIRDCFEELFDRIEQLQPRFVIRARDDGEPDWPLRCACSKLASLRFRADLRTGDEPIAGPMGEEHGREDAERRPPGRAQAGITQRRDTVCTPRHQP